MFPTQTPRTPVFTNAPAHSKTIFQASKPPSRNITETTETECGPDQDPTLSKAPPTNASASVSLMFLLSLLLLLGEHPDAEVSIYVRFEGGGDDQVLSRWQLEAIADLPQVDEGFRLRLLSMSQEEVPWQMHISLPMELEVGAEVRTSCFQSFR